MLKSGFPIAIAASFAASLWSASALAIDIDALEERGEYFVIALYTAYQEKAGVLDRADRDEVAELLRGRAAAVEAGAELFPFHPMGFPTMDAEEDAALMAAYDETYALVGSEAANVAPNQIAAVQIAYETWLFEAGTHGARSEQGQNQWRVALEDFIAWSEDTDALSYNAGSRGVPVRMSGAVR
jgi:hypothetical protein